MDQQTVCPQCGTQIAPSASFCTQCGATLEAALRSEPVQAQPSEVQTEPPTNPQNEEQPSPTAPPTQEQQAYSQPQGQPYQQPYQAPQSQQAYSQPQGQSYQQPYQAPQSQQAYSQPQGQSYQQPYQASQGQQAYQPQGQPYQSPQGQPYPPAPKSKMAAGLLGIFLGSLGIHNFYLGFTNRALIQLLVSVCTCGIGALPMWIWGLVEGIQILTGSVTVDAKGIPLSE